MGIYNFELITGLICLYFVYDHYRRNSVRNNFVGIQFLGLFDSIRAIS